MNKSCPNILRRISLLPVKYNELSQPLYTFHFHLGETKLIKYETDHFIFNQSIFYFYLFAHLMSFSLASHFWIINYEKLWKWKEWINFSSMEEIETLEFMRRRILHSKKDKFGQNIKTATLLTEPIFQRIKGSMYYGFE